MDVVSSGAGGGFVSPLGERSPMLFILFDEMNEAQSESVIRSNFYCLGWDLINNGVSNNARYR